MRLRWCLISVVVLSSILFGLVGCGGGTAPTQQAERRIVISRSGTGYQNTNPFTIEFRSTDLSIALSFLEQQSASDPQLYLEHQG